MFFILVYSALNPADWKIQRLGWLVEHFPVILGFDTAGVVEEVGEGVKDYVKGDRMSAYPTFLLEEIF